MSKLGIIIVLLIAAVAVPSLLFATQGESGQEARVAAFKHEDGRVEFAIQVRDGSSWGDRLLPSIRTIRETSRTGRWLVSSPVTLPATQSAAGEFVPAVTGSSVNTFELGHSQVDYGSGWFGDYGGIQTTIAVRDAYDALQNLRIERAVLDIYCSQGDQRGSTFVPASFSGRVQFYEHGPYGSPRVLRDYQTYGRGNDEGVWDSNLPAVAFFGFRTNDGSWTEYDMNWWRGSLDFDREFMHELRQYARLAVYVAVRVDGEFQLYSARFDNLQEFFGTPLQENINRCGEYPETEDYTGPRRPVEDYSGGAP